MKRSAQGLLRVEREGDDFVLFENQTWEQERMGELQTIFEDGVAKNVQSVAEIRERLHPGNQQA